MIHELETRIASGIENVDQDDDGQKTDGIVDDRGALIDKGKSSKQDHCLHQQQGKPVSLFCQKSVSKISLTFPVVFHIHTSAQTSPMIRCYCKNLEKSKDFLQV